MLEFFIDINFVYFVLNYIPLYLYFNHSSIIVLEEIHNSVFNYVMRMCRYGLKNYLVNLEILILTLFVLANPK